MNKSALILVPAILMLAGGVALAQESEASAAPASSPLNFELDAGIGWDLLFNEPFAAFLAANGMTAIDPIRLWKTGWRMSYDTDRLYVAVGGSRMSNFFFGPYGHGQRTRLVWDATDLTAGLRIVAAEAFTWVFGAGVCVSKVLLQAYETAGGTFSAVYGGSGAIDLVSAWNWLPVVETLVGTRVAKGDSTSVWLRAGVQGLWLPLDSTWKLFDDPAVAGVPKLFELALRTSLWVGIR